MPRTTELRIVPEDGGWKWHCHLCDQRSTETWFMSHALYAIYQNFATHMLEQHTLYAINPGVIK